MLHSGMYEKQTNKQTNIKRQTSQLPTSQVTGLLSGLTSNSTPRSKAHVQLPSKALYFSSVFSPGVWIAASYGPALAHSPSVAQL